MNQLLTNLLAIIMVVFSINAFSYPTGSMHWNHRSILYFAPEKDQHVNTFIKESLMHDCMLQERDIVVVVMTKDGFNKPTDVFSPEDVVRLEKLYNISRDSHTAILIGKDGLEKHRWNEQTNWQHISQLVDNMPMRKKEVAYTSNSRCSI
ncbi:DUF4174 domain-containing protein [Photobacterium sp. DNB23_23_1]|uniref:DUF4174 domain-containing protein n=1 Tax=Photobacterium pectinilyticum TaxID=2906793 RepID=A0ABT1N9P0_9GAMM|nr:DUF4174 domain-containing protein [Photobacterium sp. ZSDE20]MCQ1060852.1 DUF4174 domain-containing protein [Photobacterium sp. ZSDE20]MDD1828635.1 DUF4174 domain-containing protein [Photobacterium sp. ZSDE20]